MPSASGVDLVKDNPWRTVIKGNHSVVSSAQMERSRKTASNYNTLRRRRAGHVQNQQQQQERLRGRVQRQRQEEHEGHRVQARRQGEAHGRR